MRDDLAHLASTAGIGVREIWVWPTDGLVANAAVMGVFPGLRCVMLSDALLECMPREQVRAVMAHELGHVARKHLAWMLPVLLACWILGALIADPAVRAIYQAFADAANRGDFVDASMSELQSIVQTLALFRDAAIVALGHVIFGFVSRRFERQADAYAVRLLSVESGTAAMSAAAVSAMTGALTSVAFLNHVPVDRPSWRHGSILWRQRYLHSLAGAPVGPLGIDRFVTAICLVALALVAYLVVAFVLGSA
jgi:Zn-dependent protease with chaperone function